MNAAEKARRIADLLDQKKAIDVKVLDISDITVIADYFIICSGTSSTQVKALTDEVEEKMAEAGSPCLKKEGKQGNQWILMDFGDVVVHIFQEETRSFYDLEKLWSDAREVAPEPAGDATR